MRRAIIDSELVCLGPDGRSHFRKLLFRRASPCFAAFDLLALDGHDLRGLPLLERKRRLMEIMPTIASRILYVEHIETRGVESFEAACRFDLEGIAAKWRYGPYYLDGQTTSWLKIKNRTYCRMEGRRDLFECRAPVMRTRNLPRLVLATSQRDERRP